MKRLERLLWVLPVLLLLVAVAMFIASFWVADPTGRSLAQTGGVLLLMSLLALIIVVVVTDACDTEGC